MLKLAYLFTDTLPAVSTFHRVLDHAILTRPPIHPSNRVKRKSDDEETHNLIQERSIGHDHCPIVKCLVDGIVALCAVVVVIIVTSPQHRKLLVQVAVEKG